MCLSTWSGFMRRQQMGQATRPSSGSTLTGSGSGMWDSRRAISAVASMPRVLLRRAEERNLLLERCWLLSCCSPSSSMSSAFRFGVSSRVIVGGLLAKSSTADRVCVKAATTSSIDQLLRSFTSCSEARHSGHFPPVERARRMHREQKVWLHDVSMGVL